VCRRGYLAGHPGVADGGAGKSQAAGM